MSVLTIPFTVHEMIERSALVVPNNPFLVFESGCLSYSTFVTVAQKLSRELYRIGVRQGQRVVLGCRLEPYVALFWHATSLLNSIMVPVSPQYRGKRLKTLINDCDPTLIVTSDEGFADRCRSVQVREIFFIRDISSFIESLKRMKVLDYKHHAIDEDVTLIMYTSGSTGKPKGIALTHSNVISATESIARYLEISENDRILNTIPLSFDYGLYQILLTAIRGASLHLGPSLIFREQFFTWIEDESITGLPLVPSQISVLCTKKNNQCYSGVNHVLPSVRFVSSTGSPFPTEHIDDLSQCFPNARLFSMYGLTECKRVTYLPPEKLGTKPGSVGQPIPNIRVRVVNEDHVDVPPGVIGQLVLEGRNIMKCYWQNSTETKRAIALNEHSGSRVLLTGDYFKQDADGDLFFVGRADDIVKIQDNRVSTKDIESILVSHPAVKEAIVLPRKKNTGMVKLDAFVALTKEDSQVNGDDLRNFVGQHVEISFMVPASVIITKELPRTDRGKIDRSMLERLLEQC